jgi:hypothetical protein
LRARQDANHSDTEVSRGLATPHGMQRLAALVSTIAKYYTKYGPANIILLFSW